ncbi:MAG: CopD family protein [Pseudomonadota bacterium]
MLWVKAFHIIFAVSWYAGLLYLPRLFVYHTETTEPEANERFKTMERKLFLIMSIGALGTAVFGFWLLHAYAMVAFGGTVWLWAKLALVAALYGFHGWCYLLMRAFREDRNRHSQRFFRMINEIPALILVGVVIAVVVKPA